MRLRPLQPAVVATALLVAASTGIPAGAAPPTSEPTDSSVPRSSVDGVLTIGTLLPQTGPGNDFGLAAISAVDAGITAINEGGGVLGRPVRRVSADEGTTNEDAAAAIDQLLARDVDAVIGPVSSTIALETLDELMDAGVLVCSPTATALSLNDYPNRQLFFRTVPSDSLTGQAMALVALNTGVDSVAVVYLDDQFGRPFAQSTLDRLADLDITQRNDVPFPSNASPDELDDIAAEIGELGPRTIVVIADSANGWAMLQALAPVLGQDPPDIIVNDALRDPPGNDIVTSLPAVFRESIQGLSPLALPEQDKGEPPGPYATNALDCTNLIALATDAAGVDDPQAVAAEMIDVSVVGTLCNTFVDCVEMASEDRNINYQGANSIDLSARGDPTRGRLGVFRFDEQGLDYQAAEIGITELSE